MVLLKGWNIIGTIIGLMVGLILYYAQPVLWKGQALVRVGQVMMSQSQSQNQYNYLLEPLPTVVERLKSMSFINAVAHRANKEEIIDLLNPEKDAGMIIKPIRNSDAIIITVVGQPKELVAASINSVVAELVYKHDIIIDSYKADVIKELSILNNELNALSKNLAKSNDRPADKRVNPNSAEEVVAEIGIISKQHEFDYKQNRASLLRESISSTNIRPTTLVESIDTSERRFFPSAWRISLFCTILGYVLSVIFMRLRGGSHTVLTEK